MPIQVYDTIQDRIVGDLAWMRRVADAHASRLAVATSAGYDLAQAVSVYLADPAGFGTRFLEEAYERYMGLHAGNFYVKESD